MAHINIHDLPRLREITGVLVRHGFGSLVRQAGLEAASGEAGPGSPAPGSSTVPFARRLRLVLAELGPTFVKLGQVLSVRPDIVPAEVIAELETLQDSVPPAPWDEVAAVLERELGGALHERFTGVEEVPLASASIAQVHAATLATGERVAVKVQRPGIEARIRSDLHILYTLAHFVEGRIALPGLYTPVGIVREFEAAMNQELDFLQEARSASVFARNFAGHSSVVVPAVHERFSTRRVMVMDLIEGRPFRALGREDRAEVDAAMDVLIEASYLQVFEHGFFHGDPHPGNLMLLDDGRLAFLDFGLTGRLTAEMQDTVVALFVALVFSDAETVALTLYRAGATEGRVDLKGFKREVERLMAKYQGATLEELGHPASLVELVDTAARFRIRLVPEFVVLVRTASILDGIARRLLPDVDIVERVRPYAQRLVGSRLSTERLTGDALRVLQHAQMAFQDVPLQLNQLMMDLERGNLTIRTADEDAGASREELRQAGMRVAVALSGGALLLSGAVLVAPFALSAGLWGLVLAAGLVMVVAGAGLLVAMVGHYLVASRIDLGDLRRQALAVVRFFLDRPERERRGDGSGAEDAPADAPGGPPA